MKRSRAAGMIEEIRDVNAAEPDWGLLYGYGVFETMRTYGGGALFLLDEHVDRLLGSAAQLAFESVPERREIVDRAHDFCRELPGDRIVRVTLTAGNPDAGAPPRLLLTSRPVPYTDAHYASGILAAIAATSRDERSPLSQHKTLNQLQNVIERRNAGRRGFQECLFFNSAGHLAEGSRSNVFVVSEGDVRTPSLASGILPGITRRLVIELLRRAGVAMREDPIRRDELLAATECFVTNSVMGVMPVNRIDERRFADPVPGRVTALAAAAYEQAVLATIRR